MRDNRPRRYYAQSAPRAMGPLSVVLLSVLSSSVVTMGILYKTDNVRLPFRFEARDNPLFASFSEENVVEMRAVPSVLGLPTLTALELLGSHDLYMIVRGKRQDNTAPPGTIIEQDPVENAELKIGGEVAVIVSTGPEKIRVPDIEGIPVDTAKKILGDLGLTLGKTSMVETGSPGVVEKTVPPPGTLIRRDETINLVVGGGQDASPGKTSGQASDKENETSSRKETKVPNLRGMRIKNAREKIVSSDLTIGQIRWNSHSNQKPFTILSQEPAPDKAVPRKSRINVVVAGR